jgi:hypothetical protein
MPLEKPAPTGDIFDVSTHVGALLVVEPLEDVPPMVTKASKDPQPAVRANVYVIGPPGQVTEEFHGALLFQKLLWQRLRQSLGKQVCGILTGSPGVVQNGRNVPYDLADPPDAAFEAASRAMMSRPQQQQPAAGPWGQQPAQSPATGPWGQQPAAAGPWGAAPAQQGPPPGWGQQPLPTPPAPDESVPPWERQPATQSPWGGQQ